jgi:hypothetical protein
MTNTLPRIDHVWLFLSVDEFGEGVVAAAIGGVMMPLIASDEARLESLMPLAEDIAKEHNRKIRLVKFTTRTIVKEIVGNELH